jgi:hypothetical protein
MDREKNKIRMDLQEEWFVSKPVEALTHSRLHRSLQNGRSAAI